MVMLRRNEPFSPETREQFNPRFDQEAWFYLRERAQGLGLYYLFFFVCGYYKLKDCLNLSGF